MAIAKLDFKVVEADVALFVLKRPASPNHFDLEALQSDGERDFLRDPHAEVLGWKDNKTKKSTIKLMSICKSMLN